MAKVKDSAEIFTRIATETCQLLLKKKLKKSLHKGISEKDPSFSRKE
jgi:hypothetical protein